MTIQLPIQVEMTLDKSKTVFTMALESNIEEAVLQNSMVINATIVDVPQYEGEYVIIPLADNDQVLETKDKLCTDDITVTKIPTFQTHNESGITFYIAEVGNGN